MGSRLDTLIDLFSLGGLFRHIRDHVIFFKLVIFYQSKNYSFIYKRHCNYLKISKQQFATASSHGLNWGKNGPKHVFLPSGTDSICQACSVWVFHEKSRHEVLSQYLMKRAKVLAILTVNKFLPFPF